MTNSPMSLSLWDQEQTCHTLLSGWCLMAWHQPLLSGGLYFSFPFLPWSFQKSQILSSIRSSAGSGTGSECLSHFINTKCFRKKILLTEVAGAMLTLCSPQQQNQAGWGKHTSSHLCKGPLSIKQITASYLNNTVTCKIHKLRSVFK